VKNNGGLFIWQNLHAECCLKLGKKQEAFKSYSELITRSNVPKEITEKAISMLEEINNF